MSNTTHPYRIVQNERTKLYRIERRRIYVSLWDDIEAWGPYSDKTYLTLKEAQRAHDDLVTTWEDLNTRWIPIPTQE